MMIESLSVLQWVLIVALTAYLAGVISTITVVIYDHSSPPKAMAWIMVITFFPIGGLILYGAFGRNYRKRKLFQQKEERDRIEFPDLEIPDTNWKDEQNENLKGNKGIIRLLKANNKAPLTRLNKLEVLQNGQPTFDAIIEAIQSAKKQIHLEYYIFEDGEIGQRFKAILCKKAKEGLEVRLMYDAVGSWSLKKSFIKELTSAGIDVAEYLPVRFPLLANRVNYRNHRKIVVVDGYTAFVGGVNISDKYFGRDPEVGVWRDTHLKIEGEAAACLQGVFIRDWYFSQGEKISSKLVSPKEPVEEPCFVQIASSGPDSDYASIMQAYFTAITSASHHVYISTPYFVPNEAISIALKTAAMRGVEVKLIVPQKSDSNILNHGLRSYLEEFMEAGVKVYLFNKGFNHGKLMMVDGRFCSVGTANLDIRSFDQNFEVNALVYDIGLTKTLEDYFEQDLRDSSKLELSSFKRSPRKHLLEALARLFSPLL